MLHLCGQFLGLHGLQHCLPPVDLAADRAHQRAVFAKMFSIQCGIAQFAGNHFIPPGSFSLFIFFPTPARIIAEKPKTGNGQTDENHRGGALPRVGHFP
jgi:hypothetical protein